MWPGGRCSSVSMPRTMPQPPPVPRRPRKHFGYPAGTAVNNSIRSVRSNDARRRVPPSSSSGSSNAGARYIVKSVNPDDKVISNRVVGRDVSKSRSV